MVSHSFHTHWEAEQPHFRVWGQCLFVRGRLLGWQIPGQVLFCLARIPEVQSWHLWNCSTWFRLLWRIELLQDFIMTHNDTMPWISGCEKKHQTNERCFFPIIFYDFLHQLWHYQTRSPKRMCAAVYVTPLLIFALARRCGKGTWDHRPVSPCVLMIVYIPKISQNFPSWIRWIPHFFSRFQEADLQLGCPGGRVADCSSIPSISCQGSCLMWYERASGFPPSGMPICYIGIDCLQYRVYRLCCVAMLHKP